MSGAERWLSGWCCLHAYTHSLDFRDDGYNIDSRCDSLLHIVYIRRLSHL
jgi:hypothetical protein